MSKSPVALFVYNRPDLTKIVAERVAAYGPSQLLVVADGPKGAQDRASCDAARAALEGIQWGCDVLTNYSERNLGCRDRVASGLDWVFSVCEEAMILEDDCLPDPSFFGFCEALLYRYRHQDRVGAIAGNNFQRGRKRGDGSYYFSIYPHIWGWASWRRAWMHFDLGMGEWPEFRATDWLSRHCSGEEEGRYWTQVFDDVYAGRVDTWDAQWVYSFWRRNYVAALPNVNLVSNIGFSPAATHTRDTSSWVAALPASQVYLPLTHPGSADPDKEADEFTYRVLFSEDQDAGGPGRSRAARAMRRGIAGARATYAAGLEAVRPFAGAHSRPGRRRAPGDGS